MSKQRNVEHVSGVDDRSRLAGVSWAYAYETYARLLLRYLRRFAATDAHAEDMLHDVFERAMNATNLPETASLLPWLYRIASNTAISHLRRQRLRRFLPLPQSHDEQLATSDPPLDVQEHVRLALRSLPTAQAIALVLVHHEGYSRAEAARVLGVGEATLKTRLTRGRLNFAAAYGRLERGLRG